MNKYERENFNVDEISKFDEYQRFEAEDFKSLELFRAKKEEELVEEIQKQSFVNEENTSSKSTSKNNNKVFDKLKNKIMSSSASTSASVATSIGSAGALVCAGVLGAGIVLSPVLDLPIFPDNNDFGTVELLNYSIDTKLENDTISKTITIYFEEQLKDEFDCYILNKTTNDKLPLDTSLDYVIFENLFDNEYQFEIIIQNDDQKVIDTNAFFVKTFGSVAYTDSHDYNMLVTYNDDNTFNVYYLANYDYTTYDIDVTTYLTDHNGNEISSTNKIENNVFCFENIQQQDFSINTSAYLIENNNKYLIHNEKINYEYVDTFSYDVTVENQIVKLYIDGYLNEDIEVILTYLDDDTTETYIYAIDEWTGNIEIPLTKNTKDINIEVNTATFYPYSTSTNFVKYKGNINMPHNINVELPTNVTSEITLTNIEVLNDSYYNYNLQIPTTLKFDGYIYKDSYYKVYVYDSTNQLIDESESITTLNTPIYLYDLPTDDTLSFKYVVYDSSNNELFTDSYQTSLALPSKYEDITSSLHMDYPNPGDITQSFNDDGTINLYFAINFENNSSYDAKARISLVDNVTETEPIAVYSSDKVAVIENVNASIYYGINYGFVVNEGIMTYAVNSNTTPSGTIGNEIDEDGNYKTTIYVDETEVFKNYSVDLQRNVNSDLDVVVMFDTSDPIKLKVSKEDIIDNKFILDLSSYEFTFATIEVLGIMDMSNANETILSVYPTLKGNIYVPTIASGEIHFNHGYVNYKSFSVDSRQEIDSNTQQEVIYKDISINIDLYIGDFFDCKVINKSDGTYKIVDKELESVVFSDLLAGTYEFDLQIVDENGKVYDTTSISINTEGSVAYSANPSYDSLITYNENDGTYNFYYYPIFDHTNNEIETTYVLHDKHGNEIDSGSFTGDYEISFTRLEQKEFKLSYTSKLIDGENIYLIANTSTELFELDTVPFVTKRISEDEITLSIENELDSDINVLITYKDYGTTETFTFSKDTWTGSTTIKLSQISSDVEMTVSASLVIYNKNDGNNISYYEGTISKIYESSETLSYQINVSAELESVDILNESFANGYSTPTMLRFKGYKKPEQYLTVNVYDSSSTLIDSLTDLNDLYGILQFDDLITTENVTFEYIIYESDKTTEVYKNTYETLLVKPSEYTSDGITYSYFNPSDVTITFNNDETFNAYMPIGLENTTSYDVYARVELITPFDDVPYDVIYAKDSYILREKLDMNTPYTLRQTTVIKEGINYYALSDAIVPSGSLISPNFENGAYNITFTTTELSSTIYNFEFIETITSDVTATVLFDGTTEEVIIINYADIYDNSVVLDLTLYSYTTATIILTGTATIQYHSSIEGEINDIKGVKDYAFSVSYSI